MVKNGLKMFEVSLAFFFSVDLQRAMFEFHQC